MKLSAVLLGAISTAVLTSTTCKKQTEQKLNPQETIKEPTKTPANPPHDPDYCPLCGKG